MTGGGDPATVLPMKRRRLELCPVGLALLLAWAGSCTFALGNPIAVPYAPPTEDPGKYLPTKQWERCLVAVAEDGATVSCAIGYALRPEKPGSHRIEFYLPVLLPAGSTTDGAAALKKCAPRMEVNGEMYRAVDASVLSAKDSHRTYRTPAGMEVAVFHFSMEADRGMANATVTFSYRQPLQGRHFVYVPLFEDGRDPPAEAEFTLTAFPASPDLTLSLESRNKSVRAEMQTRVTVNLRQSDEIQIAVK